MSSPTPPSGGGLPTVAEAVLKRRRRREDGEARAAAAAAKDRKRSRSKGTKFVRPEALIKKARKQKRSLTKLQRAGRRGLGDLKVDCGRPLAVVVRIRAVDDAHPRVRLIMRLLNLRNLNAATFLKLNPASLALLRIVQPYVTWGTPSKAMVSELVYKRGERRTEGGGRARLTDNAAVEAALGHHNIICIEDILHEIDSVGPGFTAATRFLAPLKLGNPSDGWTHKSAPFERGGEFGDRGPLIDLLLKRMI